MKIKIKTIVIKQQQNKTFKKIVIIIFFWVSAFSILAPTMSHSQHLHPQEALHNL